MLGRGNLERERRLLGRVERPRLRDNGDGIVLTGQTFHGGLLGYGHWWCLSVAAGVWTHYRLLVRFLVSRSARTENPCISRFPFLLVCVSAPKNIMAATRQHVGLKFKFVSFTTRTGVLVSTDNGKDGKGGHHSEWYIMYRIYRCSVVLYTAK